MARTRTRLSPDQIDAIEVVEAMGQERRRVEEEYREAILYADQIGVPVTRIAETLGMATASVRGYIRRHQPD